MLPLAINIASTLAAGVFALLLARECRVPLDRIPPLRLVLLTAVVAVALDLPGLAILGLEHSLHIAMTVAYLLGLVRFVRRGRCDWWWFVCILIQPIIRFEAAGMLVADALIFVAFRRYGYALATLVDWRGPGRRLFAFPLIRWVCPCCRARCFPAPIGQTPRWSRTAGCSR